jgi:pyruvate dehydrogenase E1 component alpha subunit
MGWTTAISDISIRAAGYGMAGLTVDGNDVLAVYQAAVEARDRALAGEGPTLLECKTYRFLGHYIGDPEDYRTPEEVEEHKKNDPLPRFEKVLVEAGILNESLMRQIVTETQQEAEEALEFALSSPDPDPSELTADVRRPFNTLGDLERVSNSIEEGVT